MRKLLFIAIACLIPTFASAQQVTIQTVPFGNKGKEAWLVESKNPPIVHVRLSFADAGASSDANGLEGRAKMLGALLSEGAGNLDSLAFNEALESHAIRLAFSVDSDRLSVEMETLAEHTPKAFELLGLALTKPRFEESAIKRVKSQMLTALKLKEEQPEYIAAKALSKAIFGTHPYAGLDDGTAEGITAVTKAQLKDQLKRYITAENIMISIVGDINAPELKNLLDRNLSSLPERFTPTHKVPEFTWNSKPENITIARPIPQVVTAIAGAGINRSDKDFYAAFILNHLIGGGTLTSKLGDEIREKRGLAYYVTTNLQVMDHGGVFTGGFGTRSAESAQAMQVLNDTLATVRKGEISDKEIGEAKSYIIGAWPLALSSNDKLAAMLQVMQRFNLGKDYLEKRNGLIEAVTKEDILRVANRLIDPEKLVTVSVGAATEKEKTNP